MTAFLLRVPALPLAHAGEGATWQSLVTAIAIGFAVVFVLAVAGKVPLASWGDLVLPLAAVAILSSLAPIASATLSDWAGYAVPAGVVLLLALLVAAGTDLELGWTAPLALAAAVLAVLAAVVLGNDLNRAWHPPAPTLPLSDDAELTIAEPAAEATVPAGEPVTLRIELSGATVGPPETDGDVSDDPEELGRVRLFVDGIEAGVAPQETCTVEDPCTSLTYVLEDLEPGAHSIIAEFVRADGVPLAPSVFDRITITVE